MNPFKKDQVIKAAQVAVAAFEVMGKATTVEKSGPARRAFNQAMLKLADTLKEPAKK